MSERPELVEGHGWRKSDAERLWRIFNRAAFDIANTGGGFATTARRMRLLAHWLQRAATDLDGTDRVAEAAAEMDAELAEFLARRAAGERGEDGR